MRRHRELALGAMLFAFALQIPALFAQAPASKSPSPCASSAGAMALLQGALASIDFRDDSTRIAFVRSGDRESRLDRAAKRVREPAVCRRANRAWFVAVGGKEPDAEAATGSTAVVRVGSFYLIAVAENYEIVLVDRRWRVLSTVSLDND